VIPHLATEAAFNLPDDAHAPDPEDISEEGYGAFRGTWNIGTGWPREDAAKLLDWERRAVAWVDRHAASAEIFDELAAAVEAFSTDDDLTVDKEFPELADGLRSELQQLLDDADELLDGIDLGVAGLVAALSASGFFPAASCRGHVGARPWSDRPAVFFGATRDHVALLEAAVLASGSRLDDGSGNGNGLVVIHAPSVVAAMDLAEAILALELKPPTEADATQP
jgi:hypothetical protein